MPESFTGLEVIPQAHAYLPKHKILPSDQNEILPAERASSASFCPRRATATRVARVRCASARRSSCGRGPGAQPPDFFWEIIPSRVPFYNRVHFFTTVFKYRIITSFVSASCILNFNGSIKCWMGKVYPHQISQVLRICITLIF